MSFDIGRIRHLAEQMHRSEDDAGDPITAGYLLAATGDTGLTWTDPATLGGVSIPFDHGSMGATETFDLDDGAWHRGTLTANLTTTITGFTVDEGTEMLLELVQDGTGGWDITWDADVDFGGGDDQPGQAPGDVTFFILWASSGDTAIYGAKVGAGGSSLTPATTVEDETTFGITPAVGTDLEYARQDHTHGTPGDAELEVAGHYELLMTGSGPPEPIENGTGDDWLYVWVPG